MQAHRHRFPEQSVAERALGQAFWLGERGGVRYSIGTPMTKPPALRVHLHHTSGLVSEFEQEDEEGAAAFLGHLNPRKIFTTKLLILGEFFSVSNVATAHLARIDVLTDQPIACQFPDWVLDLVMIPTREQFLAAAGLDSGQAKARAASVAPGEMIEGYVACHLLGAEPVYARIQGALTMPLELRSRFVHLFDLPFIQFRREEGGTTLINPAHLVRITTFPGPSGLGAADVWPAELVTL